MKVKVYVIDLEIPLPVKKWGLRIGIPIGLLLGGGAVAYATGLFTFADGQPLTAEQLNGNFAYLQGQINGDGGVQAQIKQLRGQVHPASAFHAYQGVSAAVSSATTTIPPLVFDSVEYDLASEYDKSSGVFTPQEEGEYIVACGVLYAISPASTYSPAILEAIISVNGKPVGANVIPAASANYASPELTTTIHLNAGDSVTCGTWQNTGATLMTYLSASLGNGNAFGAARLY